MGWAGRDQKLRRGFNAFQSSARVPVVVEDGGHGTPWGLGAEPQAAFLPQVQDNRECFLTYLCFIFRNAYLHPILLSVNLS